MWCLNTHGTFSFLRVVHQLTLISESHVKLRLFSLSHQNKALFYYWVLAFVQFLQSFSVWFSAIMTTAAGYTAEHLAAGPLEPVEYQVEG